MEAGRGRCRSRSGGAGCEREKPTVGNKANILYVRGPRCRTLFVVGSRGTAGPLALVLRERLLGGGSRGPERTEKGDRRKESRPEREGRG